MMATRERRPRGRGRLLACLIPLAAAGCHGDATAPGHQLALDLRIPAPQTHTGTWLSTFAEARLAVRSSDGQTDRVLTAPLDSAVSEVRFAFELDPGQYVLDAEIVSNNQIPLYSGSTQAAIDQAAFVVTIDVDAVDAVMLVQPGTPAPSSLSSLALDVPLTIRNAGIRDLLVNADVSLANVALICGPTGASNCVWRVPVGTTTTLTITVYDVLAMPEIETFQLWLDSDVGRVTIDVAVPQG